MNHLKLLLIGLAILSFNASGQTPDADGIIRCGSVEADANLRQRHPNLGSEEDFERWMQLQIDSRREQDIQTQRATVYTIPVVFHVIHNNEGVGSGNNLSAALIQAQLDQMNDDFRRLGAGANTHPDGADVEIEFCLATENNSGGSMAEPGINRVNRSSKVFSAPPYTKDYVENIIKSNTQWDPDQYLNIWLADLSGGLLGYAQFPEAASLGGIGTGNGVANTDGVVILTSSVGSVANPNPNGGNYDAGRTMTHEVGHWLGLRHIWGDGGCGVDDYVADTPESDASNGGCPTGHVSCGSVDMVENYMDYTYDACMNIFTLGQKARMRIVMGDSGNGSPRRAILANSTKCGGGSGPTCSASPLSLSITFDNYPEETSWNVKNSSGTTIASGGTYGSQADGSTLNLNINLDAGDYTFTISDSYGDGICCSYGNGSFTLSSGSSTIATGGNYGASSSTSFCIEGGADTQAPSSPTNLSSSGTTETTTTLSWAASADNVGVTGYEVFQNGSSIGTVNGTSATVNGLTAATTYSFYVRATDAAGNVSGNSNTINVTTNTPPDTQAPSSPTNLSASGTTQTSTNLSWSASTDNVGVAGYDVYRNGSNIGNTANTYYVVTGLTASTTYSFYVRAKDVAGNVSGNSNTISVTTQSLPSSSCTANVSSYPYEESFESGMGLWTQGSGDDFNWTRDANGTPSTGTGPTSGSDGSWYMYVESSSPNYSNKTTILNGPCFDLSSESAADLTFDYHLYGASNMGNLKLEASTNNGSSWTEVWSVAGNKGSSWLTAEVDLSAYLSGAVKLRFVGTTGTTWRGDMAVDNIALATSTGGSGCTDIVLSITFDNYPEETSWEIRDASNALYSEGGTYGSQADGSTINLEGCLPYGCYSLVMKDQYGDGICCSYGNGSYSLTANGSTLASGGSFGSSETTNFCVDASTRSKGSVVTTAKVVRGFEVYPNPSKGTFNLNYVSKANQELGLKVIDFTGRVVQEQRWNVQEGQNKISMDVKDVINGNYLIVLTSGDEVQTKNISIMK